MDSPATRNLYGGSPVNDPRRYGSGSVHNLAARSNAVRLCLRCRAPMRAPLQLWRESLWYWICWRLGHPLWHGEQVICPSCGRMHLFSVEIRPFGVSRPPLERCD